MKADSSFACTMFTRAIALCALLFLILPVPGRADPLTSSNDGRAKQASVAFVQATTTQGSARFVPPAN
jgi:hypothetical protein